MYDESFYDNMLFNYETSHRTYHRNGELQPVIKTVYKPQPPCYRIRPSPLKYTHTISDWKDQRVPVFNLLHKRKEIVRTNPWEDRQPYDKLMDTDLAKARKMRPRIIMTPAVSLDDVSPETRELLIQELYTTSAQRTSYNLLLASLKPSVKAPLPSRPSPANQITLPKPLPPYVSPEWRMETTGWDRKQLRAFCWTCREFYLARHPRCNVCDITAANEAQRKLAKRMKIKDN